MRKTEAEGDRLTEAKYINKSLLALGQVFRWVEGGGVEEGFAGHFCTILLHSQARSISRLQADASSSELSWWQRVF